MGGGGVPLPKTAPGAGALPSQCLVQTLHAAPSPAHSRAPQSLGCLQAFAWAFPAWPPHPKLLLLQPPQPTKSPAVAAHLRFPVGPWLGAGTVWDESQMNLGHSAKLCRQEGGGGGAEPRLWVHLRLRLRPSPFPQHCLVGGVRGTAAPTSRGTLPRHPPFLTPFGALAAAPETSMQRLELRERD